MSPPSTPQPLGSTPAGAVIHWARRYDLLIGILTLGRESRFRRRLLDLAGFRPGESMLDVGCGTGTLAIEAKRAGANEVRGIDAGAEMIARAKRKAARAHLDVRFDVGLAQSLPFADGHFDLVLSTVMMHHLPKAARSEAVREARRVLKPGGRLLLVDFGQRDGARKGLLGRIHRTGGVDARKLIALVTEAEMQIVDSGPAGQWDLQYVLSAKPL